MKVKTLIAKLQKFDPESKVYVDQACAMPVVNVLEGYYIDDEFDGPQILCVPEDELKDYDISEGEAKKEVLIDC